MQQKSNRSKPALDPWHDQTFTAAAASVRQLIANSRHKTAVDRAKELHKAHHSADSEALLIDAYTERIRDLIRQNLTVEANSLLDLIRERYPNATERLAVQTVSAAARAGKVEQLLGPLNDVLLSAEHRAAIELAIQEHITDLAALAECPALPAEHPLRQAAASLQKAFEAVTSGPVTDELLAFAEVSRRSPLAPWKMLIWAIASFYRRDDEACRRYLDAIKPESAPARLVPAIGCMLGDKPDRRLPLSGEELVSRISGDSMALKHALEKLDRAFETEEQESHVLDAIREAVQACRRSSPGQVEQLRQHISVRASVDGLEVEATRAALGGTTRRDAYFCRLFARGLEQRHDFEEDCLTACLAWNEFRLKAVEEGWFPPNGAAVSTLYLHMARLLKDLPDSAVRSAEQTARHQNGLTSEDLFFIHPEKLYERACVLDPHSEAFSQWLEWAKARAGVDPERVAEAWHKIIPEDIEPILFLMAAFEARGAFPTALQYLVKAEQIDGVNSEVRRARLRLLAGNVLRGIQRKKPDAAEKSLEELRALPQMQQADRPAYLAALRYMIAAVREDFAERETHRSEVERLLEGRATAALLIVAVGAACKRNKMHILAMAEKLSKPERAALPTTIARLRALARDMQFPLRIPREWMIDAARQFRKIRQTLDETQLAGLGEAALESGDFELAYAVSTAALERGSEAEAQFLFLRAQCLPTQNFERRMVCAATAAKLARRHGRHDLAGQAQDLLRGPFKDGSIELTDEQVGEVLQIEKNERAYPKGKRGPKYRSIVGRLCSCPDCRRERGETPGWSDDFEDAEDAELDDDLFGGLEMPPDMPAEIAAFLIEETARAVANGESLNELLGRLGSGGLPPQMKNRRGRRK